MAPLSKAATLVLANFKASPLAEPSVPVSTPQLLRRFRDEERRVTNDRKLSLFI
jgi:hypothetical protein